MALDETLLKEHLAGNGLLEMFLKGHLWVELCLNRALEIEFVDSSALDLDRLQFSKKIDIGQALGLFCKENAVLYRAINRLRNRLAHQLTGEPNVADIQVLEGLLHGISRVVYDEVGSDRVDPSPAQRLRFILFCILFTRENENMQREFQRKYQREIASYALVREVEHRVRSNPRSDAEISLQCGVPSFPNPQDVWVNLTEVDYDIGQNPKGMASCD